MATEDFLGCLSKAGIEKVGSSLRVLPRPRVKDTRAEVIKQASGTTYVHPAALFALTKAELALHTETPREYSWERGHPTRTIRTRSAPPPARPREKPRLPRRDGSMSSLDPDDFADNGEDAEENAHLENDFEEDEVPA